MKRCLPIVVLFVILLFGSACQDRATVSGDATDTVTADSASSNASPASGQEALEAEEQAITPEGYDILADAWGDLDKDGEDEHVVVYETNETIEGVRQRELRVLKVFDGEWRVFHIASGPVLTSADGGALGDPFESVSVERGCIVLRHFGGSRIKWNYTHRFRYQEDSWRLIGATSVVGAPCDYQEQVDYNLSTGKIHYSKETEVCDEQFEVVDRQQETDTFDRPFDALPEMQGFSPGGTQVTIWITEDTDVSFYY
ncbi:MAG: hypothetical protein AAGB22_07660 [Bacteroidota bacterium]